MNVPIWPGSSSFEPGETPFGFYDYDAQFQNDAGKVSVFCARRLGYPLMEIELQDINFYTAFEEAITTYGNEVYAFQLSENYLTLEGMDTGSAVNNQLIRPNLSTIIRMSQEYGTEAGVGGNVTWRRGEISMSVNTQTYDLNAWATSQSIASGDLEVRRVFYREDPPIVRYFDPYAGTGTDAQGLMDSFGFGSYSPGINFLLMPINYDLQKIQAIEFNDTIRKSNYSFELINNQLRIFPIPTKNYTLYFDYILKSDRNSPFASGSVYNGVATNVSNIPYNNPTYALINAIGRQWIFEYTLALSKEMLGYVRGKYTTIPIPNADVTLNHADLISDARTEKAALLERLRGYLDETSRSKLLEKRANEGDNVQKELAKVPHPIYVG
jgi:hypothetical protein